MIARNGLTGVRHGRLAAYGRFAQVAGQRAWGAGTNRQQSSQAKALMPAMSWASLPIAHALGNPSQARGDDQVGKQDRLELIDLHLQRPDLVYEAVEPM